MMLTVEWSLIRGGRPAMKSQKPHRKSIVHYVFRHHLPMESETTLFILVSAMDIIMTWILLSNGGFVESNPVANFFLAHWGKKGFVGFKFASVLTVCISTQLIARKHLRLARLILSAGTLVVGCVVIYSLSLYLRHGNGVQRIFF